VPSHENNIYIKKIKIKIKEEEEEEEEEEESLVSFRNNLDQFSLRKCALFSFFTFFFL
jgi:hypothetical protein